MTLRQHMLNYFPATGAYTSAELARLWAVEGNFIAFNLLKLYLDGLLDRRPVRQRHCQWVYFKRG